MDKYYLVMADHYGLKKHGKPGCLKGRMLKVAERTVAQIQIDNRSTQSAGSIDMTGFRAI